MSELGLAAIFIAGLLAGATLKESSPEVIVLIAGIIYASVRAIIGIAGRK